MVQSRLFGGILACLSCVMFLLPCFSVAAEQTIALSDASDTDALQRNDFLAGYTQTLYNDENGMLSAEVTDIYQSKDGYIWIATYGGLIRYDGNQFENIRSNNGKSFQFSAMSLCSGTDGTLWVGTNGDGIIRISEDYTFSFLDAADGLPSTSVRTLHCMADGTMFIGTTSGVCSVAPNGTLTAYPETAQMFVRDMTVTPDNRLVAVSEDGSLAFISPDGKVRLEHFFYDFSCVRCLDDTNFQLGTASGQLLQLNFDKNRAAAFTIYDAAGFGSINHITCDTDGRIWVAADAGLGVWNADGTVERIAQLAIDAKLKTLIQDSEGSYWICSDKYGVLKLIRSRFNDFSFAYQLPEATVNAVYKYQNAFYIGTDEGLLIVADDKRVENDLTRLLTDVRVRGITEDRAGNLCFATYGDETGVVVLAPNGSFFCLGTREGLCNSKVRNVTALSDGRLLVGTADGISLVRDGAITESYDMSDGLTNSVILCVCEAADGTIYIGTDGGGIVMLQGNQIVPFSGNDKLASGIILRMTRDDKNGVIWFSTGNATYCLRDGSAVRLNCGEIYNNVFDFLVNGEDIWLITSNNIYITEAASLLASRAVPEFQVLPRKYGLSSSVCSNAWNYLDTDGRLYLCCVKGVNSIDVTADYQDSYVPRILLTDVRTDDDTLYGTGHVEVPSTNKRLTIHLSALNYIPSDGVTVEYYLEGQDSEYISVNSNELTSVSYTNLRGGTYRFHLRVMGHDGVCVSDTIPLVVVKEHSFFEIPVVIVCIAVLALGLLILTISHVFHVREKQMAKRRNEMKDILGQAISAITNTIDAKDAYTSGHSKRVADYSVKLARHMEMSKTELERLYYIALLHDVGKIGVPDSILNKPGRLTDEEFATMRLHTTIGCDILSNITAIQDVSLGAKQHHERWDGKGYNEGLAGEQICLSARIICVADSFDAMATNRAYRKHLSKEEILGEFIRCNGQQFDPKIGQIMVDMLRSGELDEVFAQQTDPPEPPAPKK